MMNLTEVEIVESGTPYTGSSGSAVDIIELTWEIAGSVGLLTNYICNPGTTFYGTREVLMAIFCCAEEKLKRESTSRCYRHGKPPD